METDFLLSEDNSLIANYQHIYENNGLLIVSFPRDKFIISWFKKHMRDTMMRQSDSKEYSLLYFIPDVIRYNIIVLKRIIDQSIPKINIIPSEHSITDAMEFSFREDFYEPKLIVLILYEMNGYSNKLVST